jgi:hypothetical protein
MGNFDYPYLANDVNLISIVLDQSKVAIFQVASFRTSYFNDPWILPSSLTSMEGIRHPRMAIPLSPIEFAYSIVQKTSANPDLAPPQELVPVIEPIWPQESLTAYEPLDLVFPSDKVIFEAMTEPDRCWDDLHHKSYFLLELKRIEEGEFITIVNGDAPCPVNPLATHGTYAEENMASIAETIPIDISRTPGVVENVFVRAYCSPKEIQIYIELFKEFCNVFVWSY